MFVSRNARWGAIETPSATSQGQAELVTRIGGGGGVSPLRGAHTGSLHLYKILHMLNIHTIEKAFLYRPVERCRYRRLSWMCSRLFVEEIAEFRACFVQNKSEVSEQQHHSDPAFHKTYGHRTWTNEWAIPTRERACHFWGHPPVLKTCSATTHLQYRKPPFFHCDYSKVER